MAESLALKTKPNIDLMLNSAQNFESNSLKLANAKKQDITGASFSNIMNDKINANVQQARTAFVDKIAQTNKASTFTKNSTQTKNPLSIDSAEDFRKNALKEAEKKHSKKEIEKDYKKDSGRAESKKETEEKVQKEDDSKTKTEDKKEEAQNDSLDNKEDVNSTDDEIQNKETDEKQENKKDKPKKENADNPLDFEHFQENDVLLDNKTNNNEENETSDNSQILSNIDYSSFVEPSPVFSSMSETKERSGNGDFALDESQDLVQSAVPRTLKVEAVDSMAQNTPDFQGSNGNEAQNKLVQNQEISNQQTFNQTVEAFEDLSSLSREELENFIKNNKLDSKNLEEISKLFEKSAKDLELNPETVAKINELIKNANQKEKIALNSNTSQNSAFSFGKGLNEAVEFKYSDVVNSTSNNSSYSFTATDEIAKIAIDNSGMEDGALNINLNSNLQNASTDSSMNQNLTFAESFNLKGVSNLSSSQNPSEIFSQKLNQSDILNQITNKLTDSIQNGSKKLTMILRPYDLGRLSIELSTNKDGLTTNIIAQNEDVRNYIEKNINSLRQQLTDAGINVKNIEIKTAGQDGSTKYQGNFEQNSGNSADLNQNQNSKNQNNYNQNEKNFQNQEQYNKDYQNLISNLGYEVNFEKDFSNVLNKSIEYSLG